jgi:hypothetical protein
MITVPMLLRAIIRSDDYLDSHAVCAASLDVKERKMMADKLRTGRARRLTPHIYAATNAWGDLMLAQYGGRGEIETPAPHLVAIALCRQFGWRIALPTDVARHITGVGERPESVPVMPYNHSERREYPALGLTLEPAPAALFDLSPAGQALALGLPLDASEEGLLSIAAVAGRGALREPLLRKGLKQDLAAGLLGERARLVAEALVRLARREPQRDKRSDTLPGRRL